MIEAVRKRAARPPATPEAPTPALEAQRVTRIKPSNRFFSIPAGTAKMVKVRLRNVCLARLRAAPGHHIPAKLSARLRSGQRGLIKTVRLALR